MSTEPEDPRLAELGRLYDTFAPALFRYAVMILADVSEAEDVIQRVFATMARGRALTAPDSPALYLRRSVRNECFSALRGRRRRPVISDDRILEGATAVEVDLDRRLAVERALKMLPADQREVIHLKVFEGLTFQEIADFTGESINTVASRHRYALAKLAETLEP